MTDTANDAPQLDQAGVDGRRTGYAGDVVPVTGFGPDAALTLQLPPAKASHPPVLRDGKWVHDQIEPWPLPPDVDQVRLRFLKVATLASAVDALRYIPDVLPALMDFAAAVMGHVYTFTDLELEQLLVTDQLGWIKGILPYAGTGEDLARQMDNWMPAPAASLPQPKAVAHAGPHQKPAKRTISIPWPWRRKK